MENSGTVQVDTVATADAVRARYGSVLEFCRQASIPTDTFYRAVKGTRGHTRKKSAPALVVERLRAEGLLVLKH
ncbi:MAG: hypothetical protein AB7D06_08735 [Pedobacter sp.]